MSADWSRVRELFERADDVPDAEREAWLRRECGSDDALYRRVAALLGAATDATEIPIDGEVPAVALREIEPATPGAALVGRVIGGFHAKHLLGAGGMGVVLRAEQEHPRREVALKVLAGTLVTDSARRRFEYEGEVLGKLQHPHIAQVFATGCEADPISGQPLSWIAMELVEGGRTLDRWIADETPNEAERLRLLLEVCAAIEYGHRQGVLHRDLKPGNVLVDADGRAKVIDFGIARAVDRAAPGHSLSGHTLPGQLLGTPRYMSPEQLAGSADAVDTRADVYALGVMLFRLLTDREPHEDLPFDALVRIVTERDAPRPSLFAPVPVDLDWICAKAMARDAGQRYRGPAELADDLRRYLASEPVLAGPPSTIYVMRRFVRRHRGLVVTATSAVVLIVAAAIVASLGWLQAARSAELARAEATTQAAIVSWLSELLQSARAEQLGKDVRVLDLLESGAQHFDALAGSGAEVEAAIRNVMAQTWLSLDENGRALATVRDGLARMQRELPVEHSDRGEALYLIGVALGATGDLDGAQSNLELALAHRRAHAGEDAIETAHVYHALAVNQVRRGQASAARPLFERAEQIFRVALGAGHHKTLTVVADRIDTAHQLGDHDAVRADLTAALSTARESLGANHPVTVGLLVSSANDARQRGDLATAERDYLEALTIRRQQYGEHSLESAIVLGNLAVVRQDRGDLAGAEAAFAELVALQETNGQSPLQGLIARNNLASVQLRAGAAERALANYERLLGDAEGLIPDDHWLRATFLRGRGAARTALREYDAAERDLLASLAAFEAALGADNFRTQSAVKSLVELFEATGEADRAREYRERLAAPR